MQLPPDLPTFQGVSASHITLPRGPWPTMLDALCGHFTDVSAEQWRDRIRRGIVLNSQFHAITEQTPYQLHARLYYYREIPNEAVIPFNETLIYQDEHLVVADKPHFLPVIPSGHYAQQTLLTRLRLRLANPHLVPLHRIDRGTAGLVLFSAQPASRARYQNLFRDRTMIKHYQALAAPLPQWKFPLHRQTHMCEGEPFFRMTEAEGPANSSSHIDVLEKHPHYWRYRLSPVTGKKHQLRVHMAALGAPIFNDDFYPQVLRHAADDYSRPLQLLAEQLRFTDPITGLEHHFCSQRQLQIDESTCL